MKVNSISYSSDRKLARCEMQYHYRYDEKLQPIVKKVGLYRGDWMHQVQQGFYNGTEWKVAFKRVKRQLWKPLFDEEKEIYGQDFPDTVYDLLDHYFTHWKAEHDNWEILAVEKRYELKTRLGVPVRWQVDLLVREKDTGKVCLIETKNKKKIPTSEERILQPQTHAYCYLLTKVGIKVDKIIWNYTRTDPVPRPKICKDGSLSKRQINTDRRAYMKSVIESGWPVVGFQPVLDKLPETIALERITNSVNLIVGEKWVRDWVERAHRAMGIGIPLRSWQYDCRQCDYYLLCQADMLGQDRDSIIKAGFTTKNDRPEELK